METTIKVMMQGFYGNRTMVDIKEEDIDYMLLGILDKKLMPIENYKVDRSILHIPSAEHIVIVYNKYKEEEKETMNITVNIPEIKFTLHSKCIICRMNNDGEFESLEAEDLDKFINYLAK
jgi:hypothetical protein